MRIYCGEEPPNNKPGWRQLKTGEAYAVRLDGEEVKQVTAVDTIDGELWRYTGEVADYDFVAEKLSGRVDIEQIM